MKELIRAGALLLLLSLGVFAGTTGARADLPVPNLILGFEDEVAVGGEVAIAAYLVDPSGNPVRGATIVFTSEATFLNNTGAIKIGSAVTDASGLALLPYVPRFEGDLPIRARFAGNAVFAPALATDSLMVIPGKQLHEESVPFRIPGANVNMVVTIISVVWGTFLLLLAMVWRMARLPDSQGDSNGRSGAWNHPALMPGVGFAVYLIGALVIILFLTLRPWAGPDSSYATHLNFSDPPDGYTRSTIAYVGQATEGPAGWQPLGGITGLAHPAQSSFVGFGCASCHGVDGSGTAAGPAITDNTLRRITTITRDGPGGMPAYGGGAISDENLAQIADYILGLPMPPEGSRPVALPTATPYPTPTPLATATPDPSQVAPTPGPTATPVPPADPVRLETAQRLYRDVGCDLCHGLKGQGGPDGPELRGVDDNTREFIRVPMRDPNSVYPKEMSEYPLDKLSDAELDEIMYFLLYTPLP